MASIWYYSIFLFLGAFGLLAMGGTSLARRRNTLSAYFALFCLTSSIYAFGYGMEITRVDEMAINYWSRIEYLGLSFISSLNIIFILLFLRLHKRVAVFISVPLILFSMLILVIRQTNHFHWQYYENIYYHAHEALTVMSFDRGIWYWVFVVYNVSCLIASSIILIVFLFRGRQYHRRQASWLLLGSLFPILPYILYVIGLVPLGIDIIPASIIIASFTYFMAVFRYDMFSLIPVGRDHLVETMNEAVLVLNPHDLIADINPAAQNAFCPELKSPLGLHLEEACPQIHNLGSEVILVQSEGHIWEMSRIPVNRTGRRSEGSIVVGHDVTDREELVARLERMAREDPLTGLLNRHSWDEAVNTELARLSRHGRFGSIIYLDLDGFKSVNDSHGHAAGDSVLKAVGRVLKESVRRPDLVGRYGGEEFVLFLPEIHPEAAMDVAERLRVDLYEEIKADMSVDVAVTGSFGVAGGIITDDVCIEELVNKADTAMYESKRTGKNRVTWNRH